MMKKRCSWVEGKEEIYIKYHDEEWGVAKYNDDILFEMLVLESFQAGLSWITILKKREAFKEAFDNFNIEKIINYDESKVHELLENENIIRHEGKIRATINNAKVFKDIQKEEGSFSNYIWGFTDGKIIKAEYKTKSDLSDDIAKDLKKKGMKFVGSTTIYSYLEAIGIIDNHTKDCFRY
ncbi:DNA-3-methyladenine glycosylase I [uncultured Methanobrevibacter sp.]|uniref:DNA-3-methyladenine glycosylase I n=1 Tax=uncultured Methanobrevibacter sp. TaxID=253161 RepID=UPI0025EF21C0|nr:DNA-3-methyladenine glycosylase I [uncultured Methanobrevibacter sp.]